MEADWSLSNSVYPLHTYIKHLSEISLLSALLGYLSITFRHYEMSNSIPIKANVPSISVSFLPISRNFSFSHSYFTLDPKVLNSTSIFSPHVLSPFFSFFSAISLASISIPEHITYVPIKDFWGHCPPGWDPGFSPQTLKEKHDNVTAPSLCFLCSCHLVSKTDLPVLFQVTQAHSLCFFIGFSHQITYTYHREGR